MFKPSMEQTGIEVYRLLNASKHDMLRFHKVYRKRITNLGKHLCASSNFLPSYHSIIDRYNDCFINNFKRIENERFQKTFKK